jgi:hypothetical protein
MKRKAAFYVGEGLAFVIFYVTRPIPGAHNWMRRKLS